ncbi:hypothetical protein [Anditalea andensis]|uniref:Soluble adenylyl cyclase-like protein n=1 Tax=Anditalea andensis TaxID=1048983 RepID=A0A074KP47_9BACT|nr:hypothetical protein [Anditalea andensis]KEO71706.1 hypothetical protein EL17_23180 [Anditalea andensis]
MKDQPVIEDQILELMHERLKDLMGKVKSLQVAIAAMEQTRNGSPSFNGTHIPDSQTPKLQPISTYNSDMKLDEKIAYALSKLDKATKKEIVGKIVEAEPETNIDKLDSNIAVRLSFLLKEQQISGIKQGRVYHYSLIPAS